MPIVIFRRAGVLEKNGIPQQFDNIFRALTELKLVVSHLFKGPKYAEIVNWGQTKTAWNKKIQHRHQLKLKRSFIKASTETSILIHPKLISTKHMQLQHRSVTRRWLYHSTSSPVRLEQIPLKLDLLKAILDCEINFDAEGSIVKSILMFENEKFILNINLTTLRDDSSELMKNTALKFSYSFQKESKVKGQRWFARRCFTSFVAVVRSIWWSNQRVSRWHCGETAKAKQGDW